MKCRRCGYISFERTDACANCGWIYGRYPVLVRLQATREADARVDRLVREVVARVEGQLFGEEEPPTSDR